MFLFSDRQCLARALLLVAVATISAPRPALSQSATEVVAAGPNTAGAAALIETKATVIGIDLTSRNVTLRGVGGRIFDVEVGPEVGDLTKLEIGDAVQIAYHESLLIHAERFKSNGIRERIDSTVVLPASGGVAASAHRVQVLATVQKVDVKTRLVTLRGPLRTVVVKADPAISLAGLKPGDSVNVEFVTATAVKVTRDNKASN